MTDTTIDPSVWRVLVRMCLAAVLGASLGLAVAQSSMPASASSEKALDAAQEAQMMRIAAELRCLVCQNQTVADSHADLAVDLRQRIRELLVQGKSEQDIRGYMTERYGDFILYRPAVTPATWLLWFGPVLLAVAGLVLLVWILVRRQRMSPQDFEPDTPEPADQA